MKTKTFPKTKHPKRDKDLKGNPLIYSVDVFTYCPENGIINLGFYDYENKEWAFHTDTMEDMDDKEFIWCYPPKGWTGRPKKKKDSWRSIGPSSFGFQNLAKK